MEFSEVIEELENAGIDQVTIRLVKTDAKEATEEKPAVLSQTMIILSAEGINAQDVDADKVIETVIALQASVATQKAKHHAGRLDHWAEINRRLKKPEEEPTEESEEKKTSLKATTHKPASEKKASPEPTSHKTSSKKK